MIMKEKLIEITESWIGIASQAHISNVLHILTTNDDLSEDQTLTLLRTYILRYKLTR